MIEPNISTAEAPAPLYESIESLQQAVDSLNSEADRLLESDPELALEKASEAEKIARYAIAGEPYERGIVWGMVNQARAMNAQAEYGSALKLALAARAWPAETPEMLDCHSMATYAAGLAYDELGDLPKAQAYYLEFLAHAEQLNNMRHLLFAHNALALAYGKSEAHEMALEHLHIADRLITPSNLPNMPIQLAKCISYLNLGMTHMDIAQPDKGLDFALEALKVSNEAYATLHATVLHAVARGYWMLKEQEKAEMYFQRVLDMLHLVPDDLQIASLKRGYGDFLYEQSRYQEAETILHDALRLALDCESLPSIFECHKLLSKVAEAQQQFDVALYHHKQFQTIQSDVWGDENREKMRHLRVAYEVEVAQREAEIYRLQTEELEQLVEEKTVQLRQALEQSEITNAIRSNIIKTVSHEFRTPLTIISTASNMLHTYQEQLSPKQRTKCYTNIELAVHSLTEMLQDATTTDELSGVSAEPTVDHISFAALVEMIRQEVVLQSDRIELVETGAAESKLTLDTDKVKRIVTVLVDNALTYSEDRVRLTIEQGSVLTITVADDGMGIASADMPHIFELLYRSPRSEFHQGLGLGLFMAQRMAALMGGTISAESHGVDQGSRFTLTLPSNLTSPIAS